MLIPTNSLSKFTQAMNTIAHLVGTFGECVGEVLKETGHGMVNYFGNERRTFSDNVYSKAHEKAPILSKVGEPAIRLFANAAYLFGRPFKDTGTTIGKGAAMMAVAKNAEEAALGAGVFLGGIVGAAGLIAGGVLLKPILAVPAIVREVAR